MTKYFTQVELPQFIKSQEITHDNLFWKNKDNDNRIVDLDILKYEFVSFDNLNPSLFFFHEGIGGGFSILTNKSDKDKEYEKLLLIKNSQVLKKKNYVSLFLGETIFTGSRPFFFLAFFSSDYYFKAIFIFIYLFLLYNLFALICDKLIILI
jgi:hypothetical protein